MITQRYISGVGVHFISCEGSIYTSTLYPKRIITRTWNSKILTPLSNSKNIQKCKNGRLYLKLNFAF